MSQVKKLAAGGITDPMGIPVVQTTQPITPSQLTIKVNGNDYKTDEQSLRDKFNPIFADLVQKGEAHERDREKWLQGYETILGNAKKGTYHVNTSNGQLYNEAYEGEADAASLGQNPDGTSARKTVAGNLLSRRRKDPSQIVNMLDGYFGNHIAQDYSLKQTEAQAAAKAAADKTKSESEKNQALTLSKLQKSLNQGFGDYTYGGNANMALKDQYWAKTANDAHRTGLLNNYFNNQYKTLFSKDIDDNKDALIKAGVDVDAIRNRALNYYDPTTGKFKINLRKTMDYEQLSNAFGNGEADRAFYDRSAYDQSAGTSTGTSAPNIEGPKPLTTSADGLFTDGKQFWKDKDRKVLMSGFDAHNKLFENGAPKTGWHLNNGNPDDALSGWYELGKKGTVAQGKGYINALSKLPINAQRVTELQSQYSQILQAYDNILKGDANHGWLKAGDNPNTNDISKNVWAKHQQSGKAFKQTRDVTANYRGLEGKANLQAYTTDQLNPYGKPQIWHMITLPNGKQHYGQIVTDALGGVSGMKDVKGNMIVDPELTRTLRGVIFDSNVENKNWANTNFSASTSSTKPAPRNIIPNIGGLFNEGGILKAQVGGTLAKTSGKGNATSGDANVGDIYKSMNDPGYHISASDKAELAGLGLNLGSLAASFTGAGSVAAAGLGAAGTLTHYGADIAKNGLGWGNTGNAILGLGLDAASAVPGLGVLAEGSKIARGITKTAKWLAPAFIAMGLGKAGATVMDLASGKKKVTDLSIEDLRDLSNGIHAVVGGGRLATSSLGTTKATSNQIALANGKKITLDDAGMQVINSATDKTAAAKSVISRLEGTPVDQIQLAQKRSFGNGWSIKKPFKNPIGKVEDASIITNKGATVLKDINKYQGDGFVNGIYRNAIARTALRNPGLTPGKMLVDPKYKLNADGVPEQTSPGLAKSNTWGIFGDYVRGPGKKAYMDAMSAEGKSLDDVVKPFVGKSSVVPEVKVKGLLPQIGSDSKGFGGKESTIDGNIPDSRRIYGTMFGMNKLDGERKVSYQQIRNRINGLSGTKSSRAQLQNFMKQKFDEGTFSKTIQNQIAEAISSPTSKGAIKFKEGGSIPMFQNSGIMNTIGTLKRNPEWMKNISIANNMSITGSGLKPKWMTPQLVTLTQQFGQKFMGQPGATNVNSPILKDVSFTGAGQNKLSLPKFSIDPTTISELGRALYTSEFNKGIDTTVERPMLTAPTEVPISVRGNLMLQNAADQQANQLVKNSQAFRTSDGALQMLGNLEAQKSAAAIRMQGAAQNSQAIDQSREMALQNTLQNTQARAGVANENVQTNARATQAERQAENEKRALIAQPLMDFWKDQNNKSYVQDAQNRIIDTQIAGLGEEAKVRNQVQQIQQAIQNIYNDKSITDENVRNQKVMEYNNMLYDLQGKLTNKQLQIRKNPYNYIAGTAEDYNVGYKPYNSVALQKEGGAVKIAVAQTKADNSIAIATAKAVNDSTKVDIQDETKRQMQAMKDISDLIKMALK